MADGILSVAKHALMITGFVSVMMLVIEYLNVLTRGSWQQGLAKYKWGQLVLAAFLGATPGCLGAFAVVAMYSHGVLSLGAVVAAMIATSGDEAFVMLAMIPKEFAVLTGILFAAAIVAGALTDAILRKPKRVAAEKHQALEIHGEVCDCFPRGQILRQWKQCIAPRGILTVVLALFLLSLTLGQIGPAAWNWIRITLVVSSVIALSIVATVPDHFLVEHLWQHVARKHVPRVFLWTLGALVAMYILTEHLHLDTTIRQGKWIVLAIACLIGLIPESGPHLIFVTLYAQGTVPFSVLLVSSIVQDGHGMLPMLADSRRGFLVVKTINLVVGAAIGAGAMVVGY
ncbi:MAG: arsenic efflux protein [Planctomycetes bacterium]|nr:arsenic efflux protein [Planctomycetota bacterium]